MDRESYPIAVLKNTDTKGFNFIDRGLMIVITGASSGLGAALANLYGQETQALLISGRNQQRLTAVAEGIEGDVTSFIADLSQPEQVNALFNAFTEAPQMLIHCAGSGYFGNLEHQTPEGIFELFQSNLFNTALLLRELIKRYKDQPIRVVIVMSTAAQIAKAGESTYCAAKWGVKALVESVRLELKNSPMQIVAVYPGGMNTGFWPTSGKTLNTKYFMSAQETALMIQQALTQTEHGFVSDITINRN